MGLAPRTHEELAALLSGATQAGRILTPTGGMTRSRSGMAVDPGEQVNRRDEEPERTTRLQEWLEEWSRRECARVPPGTDPGGTPPAAIAPIRTAARTSWLRTSVLMVCCN